MNIIESIRGLLLSARGEVGDDVAPEAPDNNAGAELPDEDGASELPSFEQAAETARRQLAGNEAAPGTATDAIDASTQTQGEEATFLSEELNLDPKTFSPENQAIFKKMQGVYTKRMQEVAKIREMGAEIERFHNDPQFAQQTVAQWAINNGFQLVPAGAQPQVTASAPKMQGDVPAELIEAFKQNLNPELQWMAEPQARAMWMSMQNMLKPVLEQREREEYKAREGEWQKHADALSETAPGWEEHEDAMSDLFDFLSDKQALYHPTYGSKLQMLYDLANARAASLKQAQQRVAQAGKNRVSSGRTAPRTQPSVQDQISKAKTTQDAWEIAKRAALAQHQKSA